MDKRPIGYVPGKGNPLDKKVPKSNKYEYVQKNVQTGKTVRDIEVQSNQTIAKRKGELFKRIKCSTLANLLTSETVQESIYNLKETNNENVYQQQQFNDDKSIYSQASQKSEATKVSAITYATQDLGINAQTAFILIDLREQDDFDKFHIKESLLFPTSLLQRDNYLPAIYRYVVLKNDQILQKNQEGKLIIIYHLDEKHGMPAATFFSEKGFENVFLLNGGVESFLQCYPELIEGKQVPILPPKPQRSQPSKIYKRSNYLEKNQIAQDIDDKKSVKDSASQVSRKTNVKRQLSQQK